MAGVEYCLFENLQQLQLSERVHKPGPIIIQKSKSDQVGECVKRVYERQQGVNLEMMSPPKCLVKLRKSMSVI